MSCSEVEGECKDSVPWPTFPESNFVASKCVPNPKPVTKGKALRQAVKPVSQKGWGVFHFALCCVLWVAACQELSLQLLQPCSTQECKVIKGYPLSGKLGHQMCVEAPLWEILEYNREKAQRGST